MNTNYRRNLKVIPGILLALSIQLNAVGQDIQQATPASTINNDQPTVVTGRIVDATTNEPLSSVVVKTKDGSSGATTSDDGKFSFETTLKPPFVLVISSPGFADQEIEFTGAELNVPLRSTAFVAAKDTTEIYDPSGATITARRRQEKNQDVPIPITVISGKAADEAGAFNVNRLKELVPSVQLYSSNPRNTGINIRGLGSPFGLTNDGLDPGVGYYVDGVYYARPAAATLDFVDVERIEVLRGPQGTLFGKNTTSGAFNITTRKPSFKPGGIFEVSAGNYGYIQAKASITGPLVKDKLALRLSFSGTQRDGVIENVRTGKWINDINNQGARASLLFTPTKKLGITLSGDFNQQRPDGYAQVVAGVVKTERSAYRQFDAIIKDLNYNLPSNNAFDRKVDQDTPWRSNNDLGGVSLNADWKIGPGTLTSTSAWRYWHWNPSNDRDFTGLQSLAKSQNPAKHEQWTQEFRYAANLSKNVSGVLGVFLMDQEVKITGTEESGDAQWRFSQSTTSALWKTPGLLNGYGIKTNSSIKAFTGAVFGQVDWNVFKGLHVLPGIRFNYDTKDVVYDRKTYGGLQTTDKALLDLKKLVYTDQAYTAKSDETNISGNLTVSYKVSSRFNAFATYARSYKPAGVNVGGLPTINGAPALNLAVIKPEEVNNYEFGIKTSPTKRSLLNLTLFNNDINNYQTNVQSAELGVNRGYLANAEKVNVKGAEVDFKIQTSRHFSVYGAATYTDGKYVKFTNAPLPLEETGHKEVINGVSTDVAFKDISGGRLPGISKWAGSLGGEFTTNEVNFFGYKTKFFVAVESAGRTSFSSSATPSKYLNINEYALLNARLGFRATEGLSFYVWGRNILDKNYYEQLLVAGGNAGQYAGVLGDPRTYGVTLRYSY